MRAPKKPQEPRDAEAGLTPRRNPDLFGHAAAEATILEGMRRGRLHHAWLITGPEGVGKTTLAFRFARALLAGQSGTLAMAAADPVFRRVAAGSHADLLTVQREWDEKARRVRRVIAAEAAREIPRFLRLTPAEGGWRVVVVDGAEDLNPFSANALLKVLEEPPPRAALLLVCASPGRLLPTIRSRCRVLPLSPLAPAAMDLALSVLLPELSEADRTRLGALAGFAPGRAVALAGTQGLVLAALVEEVLAGLAGERLHVVADQVGRADESFETFMTLLCARIAASVAAMARGEAGAGLPGSRPMAWWGETWERLTRLQQDVFHYNLDRRQAVVSGLVRLEAA